MKTVVKELTFIFLALFVMSRIAFGSGEGTSGASFLKIDNCARTAAMAGAVCGVGDDLATAGYNSAAFGMIAEREIMVSHNEWFSEIKNEYAGYAQPLGKGAAIGGWVNYLHSGNIVELDAMGNATGGTLNVSGLAATLGAGVRLDERWTAGGAIKAINETLGAKSDMAYAIDAGLLYSLSTIRFGFALQNFGTNIKVNEESFSLPFVYRAGVGYRVNDRVMVSADAIKGVESTFGYCMGGEMHLGRVLSLRAGYRFDQALNTGSGISAGIGINFGIFGFDYAFLSYGDLGDTHRVSFRIFFPRTESATYSVSETNGEDISEKARTLSLANQAPYRKYYGICTRNSEPKSKQPYEIDFR